MNIEEVRKANQRLQAYIKGVNDGADDRELEVSIYGEQCLDIATELQCDEALLLTWANDELARRDAEAAERESPITEEWLHGTRDGRWQDWSRFDIGGEWNSDLSVRKNNIGKWYCLLQQDNDDHSGREVFSAGFIATRGQLLDLLAALKGGES